MSADKTSERGAHSASGVPYLSSFNIGPRLTLGFILIILVMLVADAVLLWQFHQARVQADRRYGFNLELITVLQSHASLMSFYERLDMLAESRDTAMLANEVNALRKALAEDSQRTRDTLNHLPADVQPAPALLPSLVAIQDSLPAELDAITTLAKAGEWDSARLRLKNQVRPLASRSFLLVTDLDRQVASERARAVLNIDRAQRLILLTVPVTALFTLFAAGLLGLGITRSITHPLGRLMEGSAALARGDFAHRVPAVGSDEIARLGEVFNDMIVRLEQLYRDLQSREAYLTTAQRLSQTGSFGVNPAGEIYWSPETYRIFGVDPATTPAVALILERTHPEDRSAVSAAIQSAAANGTELDLEHRLLLPNGRTKHVRVVGRLQVQGAADSQFVGAVTDLTDLKKADEALRVSEHHLRNVIEAIPSMAFTATPDGCNDFANGKWIEYTGISANDTSGAGWRAALHPADLAVHWQKWQESLASGKPFENEARLRRASNGEFRWFLIRAVALRDDAGRILKWYGTGADIEDRKRAEHTLRLSEARFAEAQRLGHTGSFAWNLITNQTYWSEETFRIYGFPPETAPSRSLFQQRVHPDDLPAVEASTKTLLAGSYAVRNFRLVMPDGSIKFIHSVAQGVRDETGQMTEILGTVMDVTEQHNAHEALRRSEGYLAEAQRLTKSGSWAWDVNTHDTFWSEEMFRIFEFDPQKTTSSLACFFERLHPDDRSRVEQQAIIESSGQPATECEIDYRIVLPGGTIKHLQSISHPVLGPSGEVVEIVGTTMDVTEQHLARTALETAFEQIKALKDQLHEENIALREEIDRSQTFEEIVGASPALQIVLGHVAKVASADSTVLITGETGTGKELVARAIHRRSPRSSRAFVSVNCASIPSSLIASELFGHEKGAFTGAYQRHVGRFELAEGGTIFLDEVGELPLETQVSLLRVLQEREFERVGGTKVFSTNVRVIAATNRDLPAAIEHGTFRSDLFYRLNVFPIEMPPLRKRREDIPMLVHYFIDRFAKKVGKRVRVVSGSTLDRLQSYAWPGNIRELQNVIERSVILSDSDHLAVDESWLAASAPEPVSVQVERPAFRMSAADERKIIEDALTAARGQVAGATGAAALLGIPPSTLDSKIRVLGIDKHRFRSL